MSRGGIERGRERGSALRSRTLEQANPVAGVGGEAKRRILDGTKGPEEEGGASKEKPSHSHNVKAIDGTCKGSSWSLASSLAGK